MRVLVDTSVWVDHLRRGHANLATRLEAGDVLCHPFVIGELACGNLKNRTEILSLLQALPAASVAEHEEVLHLVSEWRLDGRGLGWIDVHLLASALVTGCAFWTMDKALRAAASALEIAPE